MVFNNKKIASPSTGTIHIGLHHLPHEEKQTLPVAAASLLIASRGGASPQKFEKRALTIFRLETDPYESAHQLDCSCLLPTATAYGTGR